MHGMSCKCRLKAFGSSTGAEIEAIDVKTELRQAVLCHAVLMPVANAEQFAAR